jgi:hypothetical protein
MIENIYEEMKRLGVEIDHHESDLYVPVTPETTALVKQYKFRENVKCFRSCIEPRVPWYDIPFAYQPFWDKIEQESKRRKENFIKDLKEENHD